MRFIDLGRLKQGGIKMGFLFLCVCQLNIVTETIKNASKIATIAFYLPFLALHHKRSFEVLKIEFWGYNLQKEKSRPQINEADFFCLLFSFLFKRRFEDKKTSVNHWYN